MARWRHPCEAASPHGKKHDRRGGAFDHLAHRRLPRHGGNGTSRRRRRDPPRHQAQQHPARFDRKRASHRLRHCPNLALPGAARLGNTGVLVARKLFPLERRSRPMQRQRRIFARGNAARAARRRKQAACIWRRYPKQRRQPSIRPRLDRRARTPRARTLGCAVSRVYRARARKRHLPRGSRAQRFRARRRDARFLEERHRRNPALDVWRRRIRRCRREGGTRRSRRVRCEASRDARSMPGRQRRPASDYNAAEERPTARQGIVSPRTPSTRPERRPWRRTNFGAGRALVRSRHARASA